MVQRDLGRVAPGVWNRRSAKGSGKEESPRAQVMTPRPIQLAILLALWFARFGDATTQIFDSSLGLLHTANERSEVRAMASISSTVTSPPTSPVAAFSNTNYDAAGHLSHDTGVGKLFRYDAWGRLVQVHSTNDGSVGRVLAQYVYDGLGRLIARQTPHRGPPTGGGADSYGLVLEEYFYEGARRAREFRAGPVSIDNGSGGVEATPPPVTVNRLTRDEDGVHLLTASQTGSSAGHDYRLMREYIWHPASDAYVDELLAVLIPTGTDTEAVLFGLQDVNYNVVGYVDEDGKPAAGFEFTPYGEVTHAVAASGSNASPYASLALQLPLGHQGLFFEHLDAPWDSQAPSASGSGPSAVAFYHNRNRSYIPRWGRFAQRDVYSTGMTVSGCGHLGDEPAIRLLPLDVHQAYANGLSLHQYELSSPLDATDPEGLFIGGLVGFFGASTEALDLYEDYHDEVYETGQALAEWATGDADMYAFDQLLDYHWALDWDQPDDFYRGSAAYSMGTGSWAAFWGIDDAATPEVEGPTMAKAGGGSGGGGKKRAVGGVYEIRDAQTNKVLYIGRTNDLDRRQREHFGKNGNYNTVDHKHRVLYQTNNKSARRGLEQMQYDKKKPRDNKVKPISDKNKNKAKYMRAGKEYMDNRRGKVKR